MIIVVGSGPAGAACASALVGQGHRVTLLDYGQRPGAAAAALAHRLRGATNPERRQALATEDRAEASTRGLARKRQFNSEHAYELPPRWELAADPARVGLEPSFALGGFSGVWGAAMLPYQENELNGWPIGSGDLAEHFRAALKLTRLAADDSGTIGRRYPLFAEDFAPLPAGRQAARLYRRLERCEPRLTRHGILYGRARLAVEARAAEERGCRQCGLCMFGCPDGAIYDASTTVQALAADGRLEYRPGTLVRRVSETGGEVRVTVEEAGGGGERVLSAERVFLAGGSLPTTRLLMESAGMRGQEVFLRDSQYFLLPLLGWAGVPEATVEQTHTLAQVFLEILDPAVSAHTVHLQVYGYNPQIGTALGKALGPLGRLSPGLLRGLAERLLIIQGYLHSAESSRLRLRLETDGKATLSAEENPATARVIGNVVRKLRRHALALGGVPLPQMLVRGTAGRGFHAGGSFPMAADPTTGQSDRWGRPFGWRRIHAVDASVFPTIPATTITLNVMANAHRIGAAIDTYSHA